MAYANNSRSINYKLILFLSLIGVGSLDSVSLAKDVANRTETDQLNAAVQIKQLLQSGYLKVDPQTGKIELAITLVEAMKEVGLTQEVIHSAKGSTQCGGGGC